MDTRRQQHERLLPVDYRVAEVVTVSKTKFDEGADKGLGCVFATVLGGAIVFFSGAMWLFFIWGTIWTMHMIGMKLP